MRNGIKHSSKRVQSPFGIRKYYLSMSVRRFNRQSASAHLLTKLELNFMLHEIILQQSRGRKKGGMEE